MVCSLGKAGSACADAAQAQHEGNLTNDDFATLFDAAQAQSAVALYLYPHKNDSTNKFYLYGNVYLTDLSFNSTLLGTVSGSVNFGNSDTTGIKRQARA